MRRAVKVLACASFLSFGASPFALAQSDKCDYGYVWREAIANDHACVLPEVREQAKRDNAAAASRWVPASDPSRCQEPYVWRDAFPGDKVCVDTSARGIALGERQQAAVRTSATRSGVNGPFLCNSGFVWREASPTDYVCVPPPSRARVKTENAQAASRRGSRICKPGFVWREVVATDYVCVDPRVRDQVSRDNATGVSRLLGPICDQYAHDAAQTSTEARRRNCQLPGSPNRWQTDAAPHANWCQTAKPGDRNRETQARHAALQSCGGYAPSTPAPVPAACNVSVIVRNDTCLNLDGSPSSLPRGGSSQLGCGANEAEAKNRARAAFSANISGIVDNPTNGYCTVTEEVVAGCLCR